jgi:hypothetical protein
MKTRLFLLVLCALLAFAAQAHALLIITPASGDLNSDPDFLNESRWEGTQTAQPQINDVIGPIMAVYGTNLPDLYKKEVSPSVESGVLAPNYATSFSGEPNGAIITYGEGAFVRPAAFLLVKDGNAEPAWYLFYLTGLGWDGQAVLELRGFWEGEEVQGSISHVSLYGNPVPEPVSMLLFGSGLVGVGAYIRKKFKK